MESSNTQLQTTTAPHPPPANEETALHTTHEKEPSPSPSKCSSSSSSNFDGDDDDKSTSSSSTSSSSSPSHRKGEPSDDAAAAATDAPPNQEMERDASSYRIPSSVFARRDSSTQMEWSVASNESLFSIHMGNMSFTKDPTLWRSGELLGAGAEPSTSDHMFSYTDNECSGGVVADMRSRELGLAEATMKEVIKESEKETSLSAAAATPRNCRRSQGSNASTKSFAFSLMGEAEKGCSVRTPSSVRSSPEKAQSLKADLPQSPAAAETVIAPQSSWFSCFSCCSCVSR